LNPDNNVNVGAYKRCSTVEKIVIEMQSRLKLAWNKHRNRFHCAELRD